MAAIVPKSEEAVETETLAAGVKLATLKAQPESIGSRAGSTSPLLVTGETASGEKIDVTRMAESGPGPVVQVSRRAWCAP